jgi:hypothetical protein
MAKAKNGSWDMGCGASSQGARGDVHGQAGAAQATTAGGRESKEPRKPDSKAKDAWPQPTTPSGGHDGSCAAQQPEHLRRRSLLDELRLQMKAGFQRRDETFAKEIFDKHKSAGESPDSGGLLKASLGQALSGLGITCASGDVDELFRTLDLNSDGWISWPEFRMIISKPNKIEQWATTLQLAAILADSMPSKDEADPLQAFSELGAADIHAISTCFREGLVQLLRCVCLCVCVCVSRCLWT